MTNQSNNPIEMPQPVEVATQRRQLTLGFPASTHLFPLTPEGAAILTEQGYRVKVQSEAARSIHYTDNHYLQAGASVTDREEAMACDIVIHLGALTLDDVRRLRRSSMVLTLWHPDLRDAAVIKALLERHVITVALDMMRDMAGNLPFNDILAEIDGRAAIALSSSLLADAVTGKGILLGGVAGINPCEVMIVGSGISARAAARSAFGLGATVRIFDDDVYCLREALQELGPAVIGSALQPRTVAAALRSADVVVVSPMRRQRVFDADEVETMKRGVIVFDLLEGEQRAFPSMRALDLADGLAQGPVAMGRMCYTHARSAVPRTSAMALSDTLITMFGDLRTGEGGVSDALKMSPGLQSAVLTFLGHAVNPKVAAAVGMRQVDISLFLHLT